MTKDELIAQAVEMGLEIDKRWGVERLEQAILDATKAPEEAFFGNAHEQMEEGTEQTVIDVYPDPDLERIAAMNAYALRVKAGQSPDMSPKESMERIKSALIGQGYEDILGMLEC